RERALAKLKRLAQRIQHSLRDALGIRRTGQVTQQRNELIATEAGEVTTRSNATGQTFGDLHQHQVADAMPQAVVDQLEAVDYDEQQRRLLVAVYLLRCMQQIVPMPAVGQP